MTLFQNRYRIESARLPNWDYSSPGYYFVTVCAHHHTHLFGDIVNGDMQLNQNGEIVYNEWLKSFEIRKELKQDEFVVMPNHFHAVVRIVGTQHHAPQLHNTGVAYRPPKSVSSLIAGFKSTVTKQINELRKTPRAPVWHPRFHDHIIRDDRALFAIRQYIKNNPANWNHERTKQSSNHDSCTCHDVHLAK
jgi:putative transposase